MIDERKNVQPTPTRTYSSAIGPCPTVIQISRMPRHWKFTQHLRTTRPPLHSTPPPPAFELKSFLYIFADFVSKSEVQRLIAFTILIKFNKLVADSITYTYTLEYIWPTVIVVFVCNCSDDVMHKILKAVFLAHLSTKCSW